ncbi:MAG: hypothetical protein RL431_83 [Actinomycetota bacterium]|jgi:hypothetical protein
MKLDAQQKEVAEIFSGGLRYEIPAYQRNYAWKSEQVAAFLADLGTAYESEDDHFFGSIVLLDNGNKPFSVIDGQQRLTTIVLLLCVLRDRIAHFDDRYVMQHGHPIGLDMLMTTMLRTENTFELRYTANYKIAKIFENFVLVDPSSPHRRHFASDLSQLTSEEKRYTLDLRKAHSQITKWLEAQLLPFAGDEDEMKRRLYGMIVTLRAASKLLRIVVDNEDDAFILFETLNDRGLRLTASDLLKSFTLREIQDGSTPAQAMEALEKWDDAADALGDFPFTKFLRHYLLSVQKEKVQAKKIFMIFKDLIKGYGSNGALENLDNLTAAASNYAVILGEKASGDTKLDDILSRLELFSDTHRVFLLRVFKFGFTAEQLRRAARAIEVLAFRWILVGGNAQEIESFYQKTALSITRNDAVQLEDAIKEILAKVPGDDLTHAALESGSAKRDSNFRFYVLKKLNYALTKTELVWSRKAIHIEHLAPQNPLLDAGWFDAVAPKVAAIPGEPTYEDYISQWGNLSLLEYEINSSIQNSNWPTKVAGKNLEKGIDKSQIALNADLILMPAWTAADIARRTRWVADSMTKITSVPNVDSDVTVEKFSA